MRNPWHRLVSTYLQKIGTSGKPAWQQEVRSMCIRKFSNKPNFRYKWFIQSIQPILYCHLQSDLQLTRFNTTREVSIQKFNYTLALFEDQAIFCMLFAKCLLCKAKECNIRRTLISRFCAGQKQQNQMLANIKSPPKQRN